MTHHCFTTETTAAVDRARALHAAGMPVEQIGRRAEAMMNKS